MSITSRGCVWLCLGLLPAVAHAQSEEVATLRSPDGRNEISVFKGSAQTAGLPMFAAGGGGSLRYSVSRDGASIISPSSLGLSFDSATAPSGPPGPPGPRSGSGQGLAVADVSKRSVDQQHELVATKAARARDHFNELTVALAEPGPAGKKLEVIFRAYDDGVAVRYRVPAQAGLDKVVISGESTQFRFADAKQCWGFNPGNMTSSHEGEYDPVDPAKIRPHHLYDPPLTCRTSKDQTFMLAEADLQGYGGLYLSGIGDGTPGVQAQVSPLSGTGFRRDIARRDLGPEGINTPWRVVLLADRAGDLIASHLIGNLNPPTPIKDTSWIKPGKAAWDWWSGPYPLGPGGGMDMATLERFIDFAGEAGLDYMLIDAGWSFGSNLGGMGDQTADLTRSIPALDIPALVARAKARNVGVMVWVEWRQLDKQMDQVLAQYEKWGLKGIKVDYMDRDDQEMVDFYHRLLAKAAEHKLMVDLHGAYHPTGLNRTWPHFITQEGVLGAEYNKWSARATARHNVTLPFTRMVLGPLDYTPGGFRNVAPKDYKVAFSDPVVMTTRGHGLAMYVVFDSPLQMVSDKPEAYANAEGFDFIKAVPTSWDETRFLQGDIGEYVVLARRKGKDWYVGAMTNESARTIELPLDFLGEGNYVANLWQDGVGPTSVKHEERTDVNQSAALKLSLATSGGAAIRLVRQ